MITFTTILLATFIGAALICVLLCALLRFKRQYTRWWRCRDCGMCFDTAGNRQLEPREGIVSTELSQCMMCMFRHMDLPPGRRNYEKHENKIDHSFNRG